MNRKIIFALIAILAFTPALAVAADTFESIKAEYDQLEHSGKEARSKYTAVGAKFYKLYTAAPNAADADRALLYAGKTYKLCYEIHGQTADMELAQRYLNIAATNYNSGASAEAYLENAELFVFKKDLASAKHNLTRVKVRYPGTAHELAANAMLSDLEKMDKSSSPATGNQAVVLAPGYANTQATIPPVPEEPPVVINPPTGNGDDIIGQIIASTPTPTGTTAIKDIRYYSADDYTRVVIDLSQNANFEKHWLRENLDINMPPRLYVEIYDSAVEDGVSRDIDIKDGLVNKVRWAYNRPGVTRVVLDSESIDDFTVFQMSNPARIVIDVTNKAGVVLAKAPDPAPVTTPTPPPAVQPSVPKGSTGTLVNGLGLKIRTIVIDPGHGGKDPGCNYFGMKEKDIVLEISKELRTLIQKSNPDLKVYLTRETDIFIPLEERTAIANKYKADLFISVHINATQNGVASGVETYYLDITNDKAALEVAAFENQATTKSISDLQGILRDIMLNSRLEESTMLAGNVQRGMTGSLKLSARQNLGVKSAPFYVLVGAQMPAILVEAGFLSNKDDAAKLKTVEYRKQIAKGIHDGTIAYVKQYN